ncbi:MAG TPA: protein kinase [Ktedonobacterales bacterium]|jgi:serine/threonine-protein kinase
MSNLTLSTLGPYRLLSLLGVGGMAEIYRAHDPRLDREVAMKVLPFDLAKQPGFLERFRREARVVARLDHPNIMPIYDFGEEGGVMYVVMPLIEGGTLRDRIVERGACSLREAAAILYQVAQALHEAHQHALVHRDVKPANILLAPGGRAVLADFGIAFALADQREKGLTQVGMGIGTAEYMSPEQARGEQVDHRADVYALGIVLFQALTGRVPFTATDHFSTALKQIHEPPPAPRSLNPDIPPAVEAVILKALAKEPDRRFQSAAAFGAALAEAIPGAHLAGAPPGRRAAAQVRRAPWSAWGDTVNGESMTIPWLPRNGAARGAFRPAGVAASGYQASGSGSGSRSKGWVVLFTLALALLVVGGAFATVGGLRALHNRASVNRASSPPTLARQQPTTAPATSPTATATEAPNPAAVYYMAQFFQLIQADLFQGDQLGDQMSVSNDEYQALEGSKGTLYQSGDADQFGRAFGTGTMISDQVGTTRFVALVDRFYTPAQARQYYQHEAGMLSQSVSLSVGEQALAGLARIKEDRASYRLIVQDRNVVVTFATPRTATPQAFQEYFAKLGQIIDQRGHRCQFTANLAPVPGSPALCTQP